MRENKKKEHVTHMRFQEAHLPKEVYAENRDAILDSNLKSLRKVSFVGTICAAILVFLSLLPFDFLKLIYGYAAIAFFFAWMYFLAVHVLSRYEKMIMPVYYIFIILMFSVGIAMGTIWGQHVNATTFVMMLVIFPIFIVDRPLYLNILCVVMTALFIIVDIQLKHTALLQSDIVNSIVFCVFGCIVTRQTMNTKMRDIVNRKELEHKLALEKALKASEAANEAKTEFLSRMSHDIRTPMNAIIGMTSLAKEEVNPPQTQDYLENIYASSQFLLGLINDILDLSKIESAQIELHLEPCKEEDFAAAVNTVIRPLMEAKDIEFIFEMNCGAKCLIMDKLRFNQIFFNLLSNAAKFTPKGGRVEFIAEHLPEKDGMYGARYYVRDNGIGMSEEFLPHIFEAFSQEKTKVSGQNQGTGLGLPIVKSLVDAMNGRIEVRSEPGEGTEFIVDLYAKEAEPEEENVLIEQKLKNLEGAHVMLVEDNSLNVMVAKRLLEKKGCMITVADNGQEAVNLFAHSQKNEFSLILMDVRMPVMDGLEATRQIRALKRTDASKIPIIAMTADAFAEEKKKTIASGMNAHLSKPIEPALLYNTIARFLD